MNLDAKIKEYESKLAYYELLPNSYPSVAADVRQLIEWLKDYKRLLEEEKNWRKCLEDEIAKKDEKIRSLKAELDIKAESKSNTPELKPCPFCGTEVKLLKEPLWHGNHGYHDCFSFKVKCPKCGCTVDYNHNDTIYCSEEEAVANVTKAWNERYDHWFGYVHWFERAKESEASK